MAVAKPKDWNDWNKEEKQDYVEVLGCAARNEMVDQKVFDRMSKRVMYATERLYTSVLNE